MTDESGVATAAAVTIVQRAPVEAAELQASVVGQEHLLLAISAEPACLGARALARVTGRDPASFRAELLALMRPRWPAPTEPAQPTPRVLAALEEAHAEARERDRAATTADVISGILRSRVGVGFQLLSWVNVSLEAMRAAVDDLVATDAELASTSTVRLTDVLTAAAA